MIKNKRCIYLVLLFFFPELVLRIEIKSDILPGTYFWAQLSLSLSLCISGNFTLVGGWIFLLV